MPLDEGCTPLFWWIWISQGRSSELWEVVNGFSLLVMMASRNSLRFWFTGQSSLPGSRSCQVVRTSNGTTIVSASSCSLRLIVMRWAFRTFSYEFAFFELTQKKKNKKNHGTFIKITVVQRVLQQEKLLQPERTSFSSLLLPLKCTRISGYVQMDLVWHCTMLIKRYSLVI